jgi:hypothetical protein
MSAACAPARTAVYRRRRPERNVLYRTVQTHLATWLELSCDSRQGASGPAHVEREFRRYLECGMWHVACSRMVLPALDAASAVTIFSLPTRTFVQGP